MILKLQSTEFVEWWSLHEIQSISEVHKQMRHPAVGKLDFEVCNFEVSDHMDLIMIVHTPVPGSDTVDKMKVLINQIL